MPKRWNSIDGGNGPGNPFIFYYSGDACHQDGEIILKNSTNADDQFRWKPLQKILESDEINTAVVLDCDFEPKSQQNKTEPLFTLSSPRHNAALSGKLEILAAPQGNVDLEQSFTRVFTETIAGLNEQSTLKGMLDAIEELLGSTVIYENLSLLQNEKSMTLSPVEEVNMEYYEANLDRLLDAGVQNSLARWMDSAPGSVKKVKLVAQMGLDQDDAEPEKVSRPPLLMIEQLHDDSLKEEELAEWRQKCPDFVSVKKSTSQPDSGCARKGKIRRQLYPDDTEYAIKQWNKTSKARGGHYGKVYVLPVLWKNWDKEEWDAEGEMNALKRVITKHFPYEVERTFRIPDDSTAEKALTDKILEYVGPRKGLLGSDDLFIITYNGHGYDEKNKKRTMIWANDEDASQTLNWTNIVRHLDVAQCDVVQILDCCYAGNAVKGRINDLDHLSQKTVDMISPNAELGFMGRNEILASAGRDTGSPAGKRSSSWMFIEQLEELAKRGKPFTIYSWWHAVDTEASRRNREQGRGRAWWCGPFWKMNPAEEIPRSIFLTPNPPQTKDGVRSSSSQLPGEGKPQYVYAKFEEQWMTEMMRRSGDLGLHFCLERDLPQKLSKT